MKKVFIGSFFFLTALGGLKATPMPFPVGERLLYKVYWGIFYIGSSEVSTAWIEEEGQRLIALRARSRSNSFLQKIYPVNDFLEAIIDPETLLPIRFTKRLNEGRYHCDETTVFNHSQSNAFWKSLSKNKEKHYTINPDTRDMLSFLYYMRALKYPSNQTISREVMADEKLYELLLHTYDTEEVKLKRWGKVQGLKVIPEAKFQGLFIRKGKMTVWISNDARNIMLKMVVDTPFANVRLSLSELNGGPDDFWATHKKEAKKKRRIRRR